MKVKLLAAFFIILAALCLFGCNQNEYKEEDMVLRPTSVECDDLPGKVCGHFQDVNYCLGNFLC